MTMSNGRIVIASSTYVFVIADDHTYELIGDCNISKVTYTKTLGEERINKYQAWLVPFDYTIRCPQL